MKIKSIVIAITVSIAVNSGVDARYYDPGIGRFISPDTYVGDPQDPQQLNRYAYVRNNPLTLVDPSGHFIQAILIGALVGGTISGGVAYSQGGSARNFWYRSALIGAAAGGITGGFGQFGEGYLALGSIISGGTQSALQGTNVGQGMALGGFSGMMGAAIPLKGNHWQVAAKGALSGGVTGGIASEMNGGQFVDGFEKGAAAGAAGAVTSHYLMKPFSENVDPQLQNDLDAMEEELRLKREYHQNIDPQKYKDNKRLLPGSFKNYKAKTLWGRASQRIGLHFGFQKRLPSGYHLSTGQNGIIRAHKDFFNPIAGPISTIRHGYYEVIPQIGRDSRSFILGNN